MSDELLTILRLCLLGLCYLFFFRVLRAVWVETREDKKSISKTKKNIDPKTQLVVTDSSTGNTRNYEISGEITIGRAEGCTITIDDDFVSQSHARVFERVDEIMVEDLGSTNGTYLNKQKVTAPTVMKIGDWLQLGDTIMELK